ncbi:hypothetical protein HDV00_001110 [Rhizophlyctis rosea]|nr:hypothetical protein HDV00_001110 [Rhizophlyctis rosea]
MPLLSSSIIAVMDAMVPKVHADPDCWKEIKATSKFDVDYLDGVVKAENAQHSVRGGDRRKLPIQMLFCDAAGRRLVPSGTLVSHVAMYASLFREMWTAWRKKGSSVSLEEVLGLITSLIELGRACDIAIQTLNQLTETMMVLIHAFHQPFPLFSFAPIVEDVNAPNLSLESAGSSSSDDGIPSVSPSDMLSCDYYYKWRKGALVAEKVTSDVALKDLPLVVISRQYLDRSTYVLLITRKISPDEPPKNTANYTKKPSYGTLSFRRTSPRSTMDPLELENEGSLTERLYTGEAAAAEGVEGGASGEKGGEKVGEKDQKVGEDDGANVA